jgi:hypothetical protein
VPIVWLLMALAAAPDYFVVRVTDDATGRGVPLVALKLANEVVYYTDSAGVAALHEPGLEGRQTFVAVSSHGYELPRQTILGRGVNMTIAAGRGADIRVRRKMIAERLYRLTGEGIYRDSVLAGLPAPIREPLLGNGQVLGQDTADAIPYAGKLFWAPFRRHRCLRAADKSRSVLRCSCLKPQMLLTGV